MNNENTVKLAVARAYENQSFWARRKGTILTLLQAVGWALGVLATYSADWHPAATLAIGGGSYLVAAAITALTKDGFTPSMADRAAGYAPGDAPLASEPVEMPVSPYEALRQSGAQFPFGR